MQAIGLLVAGIVLLALGYRLYGGFLSRLVGLGKGDPTPAHTMGDGVDYVPARAPILLGHHFASIAGAGPIIGPIIAAQYGWLPVVLWLVLGAIFFGGMHDFMVLVASSRHSGKSVGTIIESYLGRFGKFLFLSFSWATLILVIAIFTKIVARSFVVDPRVAMSSILFIFLAVAFGFAVYKFRLNFLLASVLGVILLGFCLWLGVVFPFPRLFESSQQMDIFWKAILFIYVFIASVVPVNYLLQPRDYLNSFLLYAVLVLGFIGVFVAAPEMKGSALSSFEGAANLGPLFPLLFVTVACGAISGFHALVSSGTTAKQLNQEKDALPIGFGGMLIETVLGIIALLAAMRLTEADYVLKLQDTAHGGAERIFYEGLASFIGPLGIPESLGIGFAGLAVSAFAMTSLDTATRLARFTLQELATRPGTADTAQNIVARSRLLSTGITVAAAAALLFAGDTAGELWKVFGSANQLLAALALMAITVWLASRGEKRWFVQIPMAFMYFMTLTALVWQVVDGLARNESHPVIITAAIVLLVLAGLLGVHYVRKSKKVQVDAQQRT